MSRTCTPCVEDLTAWARDLDVNIAKVELCARRGLVSRFALSGCGFLAQRLLS